MKIATLEPKLRLISEAAAGGDTQEPVGTTFILVKTIILDIFLSFLIFVLLDHTQSNSQFM